MTEKEEKEIEPDIFTELKVSTSASVRPTLELTQSTQGDERVMSLSITETLVLTATFPQGAVSVLMSPFLSGAYLS